MLVFLQKKTRRKPDAWRGNRGHKLDWLVPQSGRELQGRPTPRDQLEICLEIKANVEVVELGNIP